MRHTVGHDATIYCWVPAAESRVKRVFCYRLGYHSNECLTNSETEFEYREFVLVRFDVRRTFD